MAQISIPDLDDGVLGEMERRQMNLGKSLGNITRKYHGYIYPVIKMKLIMTLKKYLVECVIVEN